MSDCNSTGTVRGSEHPAVAELIRDSIELWFGARDPDPDVRETISARSFNEMLCLIANRGYAVGRADAEPGTADCDDDPDIEDSLWRIDALLNATSAMLRDRDYEIDPDSIHRLLIVAGEIVHKLLPEPNGSDEP